MKSTRGASVDAYEFLGDRCECWHFYSINAAAQPSLATAGRNGIVERALKASMLGEGFGRKIDILRCQTKDVGCPYCNARFNFPFRVNDNC
jgi:hypothetical protein